MIRVLKKHPETVFVVVGEGPSAAGILETARAAGVESRVIMTGSLTGDKLADAYRAMDLFVFASTSETQGMVLAEAMAAGMPMVALDASGAREVVEDSVNGRLLPEDATTGQFAQATERLLLDEGFRRNCIKGAARTAACFSREASAERLEKLYIDAIHHRRQMFEHSEQGNFLRWNRLLNSIKLEWELIREKAFAAALAMKGEPLKNQ